MRQVEEESLREIGNGEREEREKSVVQRKRATKKTRPMRNMPYTRGASVAANHRWTHSAEIQIQYTSVEKISPKNDAKKFVFKLFHRKDYLFPPINEQLQTLLFTLFAFVRTLYGNNNESWDGRKSRISRVFHKCVVHHCWPARRQWCFGHSCQILTKMFNEKTSKALFHRNIHIL